MSLKNITVYILEYVFSFHVDSLNSRSILTFLDVVSDISLAPSCVTEKTNYCTRMVHCTYIHTYIHTAHNSVNEEAKILAWKMKMYLVFSFLIGFTMRVVTKAAFHAP
jgi:hypothetical protein